MTENEVFIPDAPPAEAFDNAPPEADDVYDGPRLPHNLEAEQALLGGLLLAPDQLSLIEGRIGEEDFFSPAYRAVYAGMAALRRRGEPLDPLLLRDELARMGELERVGGAAGLSALTALAATGAHVEHYAKIVMDKARLRRLVEAGTEIVSKATDGAEIAQDVVDFAEHSIFEISARNTSREAATLGATLHDVWDRIAPADPTKIKGGVMTGFYDLDDLTTGLHGGELIILAARPSMGKSTFALNLLRNVAIKGGRPAIFYSLEMTAVNLAMNLLAAEARVDAQVMRKRAFTSAQGAAMQAATDALAAAPVWLDDTPGLTIAEMRGKTRRLKARHDLALVVVDYLQLMSASSAAKNRSREQEVSEISRGLKGLAKELDLPVVALSQLNRRSEGRQDTRPLLSDLRESGAIEQDADMVMMLHRPSYYKSKEEREADGGAGGEGDKTELIVAKQRNGPTRAVDLVFVKEQLRFESAAPESQGRYAPPTPAVDDFA